MDIAIVGSGISGLVAAHLLHENHRVTVFEADDRVGGHTHTVRVETGDGDHAVDTGFIVYNELNYPNFVKLLARLGVATAATTMSFSVRCDRTGLEYNGSSLNRLFVQRRNLFRPRFHRMIRDILRFNKEAPAMLGGEDNGTTVGDYVSEHGYSKGFVEHYLMPMGSSIWSSPPGRFLEFPIRFVVQFFENHKLLSLSGRPVWRVIKGGSSQYVARLTRGYQDRIRLKSPVRGVRRFQNGVQVTVGGETPERFDHVILACHSDQALAVLDDPTTTERELLSAFPYQANDVLLHTDASVLPRRRRAWAAWNCRIGQTAPGRVVLTYNMNILQDLAASEVFCVTLNDTESVEAKRVIRRLRYEHPLYTTEAKWAQQRHGELVHVNRTSFCGAYWGYGFHEDGVKSALAVCQPFGRGHSL
jgi:predicted NAD/FAD-binding protein